MEQPFNYIKGFQLEDKTFLAGEGNVKLNKATDKVKAGVGAGRSEVDEEKLDLPPIVA